MREDCLMNEMYAIKINSVYYVGILGVSMSDSGPGMMIGPTKNNLITLAPDASPEEKATFKELAVSHGGEIILLNAYYSNEKDKYTEDGIRFLLDDIKKDKK
jgi:hypothetical protein